MRLTKSSDPGVRIRSIKGQELPMDPLKNVAGVALLALLEEVEYRGGFEIEIDKKIKPGSGIGSSAASAAGVVWAANELLGRPFNKLRLVEFAMKGEELASGALHADNVAPALFGGFTLVRSYEPLDISRIESPEELFATVIHPQIEVKTADSRKILKTKITLQDGIRQWGNLGGLVAGLYTSDYDLIGRSLVDHIVEPIRAILIPGFETIKAAADQAGALGSGISGSGPSIFALSRGIATADKVAEAMASVYRDLGIESDIHVSRVNPVGVRQL